MNAINLNTSRIILFLIFFQTGFFVFLFSIFSLYELSPDVYRNILFLTFVECAILAFIDSKDSIYKIFLFMMFLFNIALPIFVLFDLYSYPIGNRIMLTDGVMTVVSDKTLSETYQVLMMMIVGTSVGWLIGKYNFDKNNNFNFRTSSSIYSPRFIANFKILFFILTVMVIYRNSALVYYSSVYDFIEVMHVRSIDLGAPWFFNFADVLFKVFGFILLYQSKNRKEYIKYATIFMIPFIIQALTGARGETIAMLIVILFIYSHFYSQVKLAKAFFYGVMLFSASIVIDAVRFSREIGDVLANISIFDLLVLAVTSTSGSIGVIAYTIELKEKFFNSVPFLFGYIQGIFSFSPNYTLEGILNKNYLAQHITYIIEPAKLFNGSTIGTAMGAEFYEFVGGSMFGIFIMSILLLYVAKYLISRLNTNLIMFYIGAIYIEALILSPRGSIMKIFSKESLISFLVLILITLIVRRYKKVEN
tara:strand:+ start:407 stop:1834 length:1428 start_codon:yes stop_codon:yes gene_type:complete